MPSIINWNETSQTLNDLCVDFLLLELLFRSREEGCREVEAFGEGVPGLAMSRLLDHGEQHLLVLTRLLETGTGA